MNEEVFFIMRMKNHSSLYQKHFYSVSFGNCYVKILLSGKEIHERGSFFLFT